MYPQDHITKLQDVIIGAALIVAGSIGIIAKLGVFHMNTFDINLIPSDLQHGWPLLLIGVGAVLWLVQEAGVNCSCHMSRPANSREANYGR